MRVVAIYRPESDNARAVEDFIREYNRDNPSVALEPINIDTREGDSIATLYDIVSYPAIVVIRDDGAMQKMWEGSDLPLIDEVESYTR